jgi:hypothetical protein
MHMLLRTGIHLSRSINPSIYDSCGFAFKTSVDLHLRLLWICIYDFCGFAVNFVRASLPKQVISDDSFGL